MSCPVLRLLACSCLLLAACACAAWRLPQTKPADKGGFFLVVAVKDEGARLAQSVERTMAVFERRCDRLGLFCRAQRQEGGAPNRITLRVSGAKDAARVKAVLLAEGLKLCGVVSPLYPAPLQVYPTRQSAEAAAGAGKEVLPYTESTLPGEPEVFLIVERAPVITGDDVRAADAVLESEVHEDYSVYFTFRPEAAVRFEEWTGANINRYLAVILNGRVVTAPYIRSPISDNGVINGAFTKERAEETTLVLMTGNLPAPVELLEEGTYRP